MSAKNVLIAQIVDNLRRVFQAIHIHSRRAKKQAGLTGPQLWAIRIVADSAPIKVSELSKKMYLHPATVVGILDRLEMNGLVRRTRSRADRRVVHVELTRAGLNLVEKSPKVVQGLLIPGLESLPLEKLSGVSESLEVLVGLVGAGELQPKLLLSSEVNLPRNTRNTGLRERKKQ